MVSKKVQQTTGKSLSDYPEIAAQWHPTRNGELTPLNVSPWAHLKVWWRCARADDHEWEAVVANRTSGRGCPFCSGKAASYSNSLSSLHPEIAAKWHPTKNGGLTPTAVTPGSNKRVWWQCDKNNDHVWDAPVKAVVKGGGCAFCRGFRASASNSLQEQYPAIAAEWHHTKNGSLTPSDVVAGSGKKYWWRCSKYPEHEWQAVLANRIKGSGCAVCRGFHASTTNSLATLHPEIAKQWHPTKNELVTPEQVVSGSSKKFWWKCPLGEDHVWEASVVNRTRKTHGCPICSGKKTAVSNSLAALFPAVAAQWHPTKNGALTPFEVTANSNKIVWWRCSQISFHEWESNVQNRTKHDKGCPGCNTGWTIGIIQSFVRSLRSHLASFTAAELYILFQQNGLLTSKSKGKHFVNSLATGRFPLEEIDKFIANQPSLVDEFIDRQTSTLEGHQFQSSAIPDEPTTNSFDESTKQNEDQLLPTVKADEVLASLDSHVISSADEEAVLFLLASAKAKLWRHAYQDEASAVEQAMSYHGGEYAERVRQGFLTEIEHARALPIPDQYSFQVNGDIVGPNLMQRHAASLVLTQKRIGNWSGTGAGKTLSAIYASRLAEAKFTLICCPNSVVDGWKRNVQSVFPNSDVRTKTWNPKWSNDSKYRYLILNYEAFQQPDTPENIQRLLEGTHVDFIVVDEIHYAKQRAVENMSLRRQLVTVLTSLAGQKNPALRVLGMSATPVINNLQEGRSLIDLVTGISHDDLEVDRPTVPNCMKMHQRLVTLGIRWMPQYDIGYDQVEIPIDCGSSIEEIRALGKSGSPLELEKILTRARLPVILGEVRRKTLIYTYYVQGIDRILRDALVEAGWSVGFYTGEDKSGLEAFIEGDLDVLIGSSAISTGVDRLQHVCNRLIVNVLPWTAAEFEQLKGRIFRQGQASDRVTLVIPLTYSEVNGERWSWCEAKMQRLRFKKSVADAVVDGVVPEGHLRSPAQAYRDVMTWLERLESGAVATVARRTVTVSLDDLVDGEAVKRMNRYGDFSEMNRRWNVSHSETTAKRLAGDPKEWEQYHHLYRDARKDWALVPYEEFVRWAEKRSGYAIGDFGCGEALVAKSLSGGHTVHSFDHVAINSDVVACDMANVPLDDESLDVVLYCLSLMGTNLSDYLREAHRVLKLDGHLHIWEPTSRFGDLGAFKVSLKELGFDLLREATEWKFTHLHLLKSTREPMPSTVIAFSAGR